MGHLGEARAAVLPASHMGADLPFLTDWLRAQAEAWHPVSHAMVVVHLDQPTVDPGINSEKTQ